MKPRLSVCIPTYNRGKFLPETLESIISQADENIEIVVSDNASSDNTPEIISSFLDKFPRITYYRHKENMGADRNYLKVIDLACGDYCWFMGSDDIAEPGAIKAILEAIDTFGPLAGISVNGNGYKFTFDNRFTDRLVTEGHLTSTRCITTLDDIVMSLGDYFGYLPGQVVNRELWLNKVREFDPTPYCNAYVHIYVIGRMIQEQPRWLYLDDRCVGWRGGNDSFLSEGRLKRLAIDVIGYEEVARGLFGKGHHLYDFILKRVCTKHIFIQICVSKRENLPLSFFAKALKLCAGTYWHYPAFWYKTFPVFFIPHRPFMFLRSIYKRFLE